MVNYANLSDEITFDPKTSSAPRATGAVPGGRWDVEIAELNPKTSRRGNAYTQMVFEVINGPHTAAVAASTRRIKHEDGTDGIEQCPAGPAYIGSKIWCDKSWMFGDLCQAVGLEPDAAGIYHARKSEMLSYPVVIDLAGGWYNEKPSNEVIAIYDADNVPAPPVAAPVPPSLSEKAASTAVTLGDPDADLPF